MSRTNTNDPSESQGPPDIPSPTTQVPVVSEGDVIYDHVAQARAVVNSTQNGLLDIQWLDTPIGEPQITSYTALNYSLENGYADKVGEVNNDPTDSPSPQSPETEQEERTNETLKQATVSDRLSSETTPITSANSCTAPAVHQPILFHGAWVTIPHLDLSGQVDTATVEPGMVAINWRNTNRIPTGQYRHSDTDFDTITLPTDLVKKYISSGRWLCTTKPVSQYPEVPSNYEADKTNRNSYTPVPVGPRLDSNAYRLEAARSIKTMNGLLAHPLFDHKQATDTKAKIQFIARRPDGKAAAICVLNSPNARQGFDRQRVEITRYASHERSLVEDDNTASWLIGKAIQWAALEGYSEIKTRAGTDGNTGTIYSALGFTHTGKAHSSGNYNRAGRKNQNHDRQLDNYRKYVSVDDVNGRAPVPRRYDSRYEGFENDSGKRQTSLLEVTQSTSPRLVYSREEATDNKHIKNGTDLFSSELTSLYNQTDTTGIDLTNYYSTRKRPSRYLPAAAFGCRFDENLVGGALVCPWKRNPLRKRCDGDESRRNPNALSIPWVGIDIPSAVPEWYEQRIGQWLLKRIREWAPLTGTPHIEISPSELKNWSTKPTLPSGVGFTSNTSGESTALDTVAYSYTAENCWNDN